MGRSCGCERRFAGGDLGLAGLCGALPAASGVWLVWLVLRALRARARLLMNRFADGPEPLGPVVPESRMCFNAGLRHAYCGGLCRKGGVCFDVGLCHAYRGGGVAERRGCAGDLVWRRSPINSFLKFNLYLIFSGKIFEQKLDTTFLKFYNGSERRKPGVEGGR